MSCQTQVAPPSLVIQMVLGWPTTAHVCTVTHGVPVGVDAGNAAVATVKHVRTVTQAMSSSPTRQTVSRPRLSYAWALRQVGSVRSTPMPGAGITRASSGGTTVERHQDGIVSR